jgi:hypothetical protein
MKILLKLVKINESGKEVKKMNRIISLTVVFFLLATACALAQVVTGQTIQRHEFYRFNAYGVAIEGVSSELRTVTTENEDGEESVTVTESTTTLEYKGGSLKATSSTYTIDTAADDGSSSHTEGNTRYGYNASGQLANARGSSETTGEKSRDDNGDGAGTFSSETTETYEIRNGQALRTRSVTTGTERGSDGEITSTSTDTVDYEYELIAGSWQIMSETTTSDKDYTNGSTENVTTVKTYTRNANGICTGLSQTATGTAFEATGQNGTGTIAGTTLTLQYTATSAFDAETGWYIDSIERNWVE